MITGLESLFGGALAGTIGSIFTNIADYFKERQRNKHELAMKKIDVKMAEKEIEAEDKRDRRKQETELETSADDLQEKSYELDSVSYASGFEPSPTAQVFLVAADFIRALVRPGLTIYLIVLVHLTRSEVARILDQAGVDKLAPDLALDVYKSTVNMILFLAGTSVAWWFGTRIKKKPG